MSSTLPWSSVPTGAASLLSQATKLLYAMYATATEPAAQSSIAQALQGAQISLSMIQGEQFLATASGSDTQYIPAVVLQLIQGSQALDLLINGYNWFDTKLNLGANALFTALFGALAGVQLSLLIWLRFLYFGLCLFFGAGVEFAGYLTRSLAYADQSQLSLFLCQIVALTIAPVFMMAAIYYMLGQVIVLHGRKYSILSPLTFSYVFVSCDIVSLVLQGVGGGIAAAAAAYSTDPALGTHIMVAGVSFQVLSMLLFLFFLFDMLAKLFFHASPQVKGLFLNFWCMLLNTQRGRALKRECEPFYNTHYRVARGKPLFAYAPLVILVGTGFIYIRSVYRVAELAQGWQGYLITHESFLMTLDATMVFLGCLTVSIMHPALLIGRENKVSMLDMKSAPDSTVDGRGEKWDGGLNSLDLHPNNIPMNDGFYNDNNGKRNPFKDPEPKVELDAEWSFGERSRSAPVV